MVNTERFAINEPFEQFPDISKVALCTIARDLGYWTCVPGSEPVVTVTTYLSSLAASLYEEGIEKLVSRYDKCLNRFGLQKHDESGYPPPQPRPPPLLKPVQQAGFRNEELDFSLELTGVLMAVRVFRPGFLRSFALYQLWHQLGRDVFLQLLFLGTRQFRNWRDARCGAPLSYGLYNRSQQTLLHTRVSTCN
ncbi:hypothetical protein FHG87_008464 [Trinorchestia longiramus]|nr:hypothetical protein FHG87_008464 [Trinorchestia longiramus]